MNDRPARPDQRLATFAVILIVIGAVFLLGELFNIRVGGGVWPLFLLVPGVTLLVLGFNRAKVNTGAALPGAALTTIGLIFFYQQATNNWESWAYIWALIPLSIGVTLYLAGNRNGDGESVDNGLRMMRIFGIIFVVGLVFFELLIFDRGGLGGYLLPIVLIIGGAGILVYYYRQNGTLPFGNAGDNDTTATASRPSPFTPPAPQPARPAPARTEPPAAAAPPPPAAAAPPAAATPPASSSTPPESPPEGHFPEGEPPREPLPDDSPFPADEEAPAAGPASTTGTTTAEPAKDGAKKATTTKPRRRRTTNTTRKTSSSTGNESNEGS